MLQNMKLGRVCILHCALLIHALPLSPLAQTYDDMSLDDLLTPSPLPRPLMPRQVTLEILVDPPLDQPLPALRDVVGTLLGMQRCSRPGVSPSVPRSPTVTSDGLTDVRLQPCRDVTALHCSGWRCYVWEQYEVVMRLCERVRYGEGADALRQYYHLPQLSVDVRGCPSEVDVSPSPTLDPIWIGELHDPIAPPPTASPVPELLPISVHVMVAND